MGFSEDVDIDEMAEKLRELRSQVYMKEQHPKQPRRKSSLKAIPEISGIQNRTCNIEIIQEVDEEGDLTKRETSRDEHISDDLGEDNH